AARRLPCWRGWRVLTLEAAHDAPPPAIAQAAGAPKPAEVEPIQQGEHPTFSMGLLFVVEDTSNELIDDAHKKPHKRGDREGEAAKIRALRQLRLAKSGTQPVRKLRRRLIKTY